MLTILRHAKCYILASTSSSFRSFMTVPEAHEQLESLTAKLTVCSLGQQRAQLEKQIARCYRIIQRAQQRAHCSLTTVADILLDLTNELPLTQFQSEILSISAELIHRATTEQLALAIPAAISDHGTNAPLAQIEGFEEINAVLRNLHDASESYEHRLAVRTALKLYSIAERSQIRQIARRFTSLMENSKQDNTAAHLLIPAIASVA